jgi:hypothetical protein
MRPSEQAEVTRSLDTWRSGLKRLVAHRAYTDDEKVYLVHAYVRERLLELRPSYRLMFAYSHGWRPTWENVAPDMQATEQVFADQLLEEWRSGAWVTPLDPSLDLGLFGGAV